MGIPKVDSFGAHTTLASTYYVERCNVGETR